MDIVIFVVRETQPEFNIHYVWPDGVPFVPAAVGDKIVIFGAGRTSVRERWYAYDSDPKSGLIKQLAVTYIVE